MFTVIIEGEMHFVLGDEDRVVGLAPSCTSRATPATVIGGLDRPKKNNVLETEFFNGIDPLLTLGESENDRKTST